MQKALQQSHGAAIIETAVCVPIFAVILLGIFEFSLAFTSFCSTTYAVREGARYASMHSSSSLSPASVSDIDNVVNSVLFVPGASAKTITVTYTNYVAATQGNYVGNIVTVGITWSQPISVPGFSEAISSQSKACRVIVR